MPLNLTLASRNLFHDRLRFVATTVGIVFSVVLVMVQMGLYLGFGEMVTKVIDHTKADLWVVRKGTKCFEDPSLLNTSLLKTIATIDGVAKSSALVIGFSDWHLPSGELTPVFLIGSDLSEATLQPWDIAEGSVKDLSAAGTVAIDRTYAERLGAAKVGDKGEIRGKPVRVVAVTSGIRSFTTTPLIFADVNQARGFIGLPNALASYFLVSLKPGADLEKVRRDLQTNLENVEVLTPTEFGARSRKFWLFSTGAGTALFFGALLGVIVGTVIVAQTLYSSTKDHLEEFATLRAIGSSKGYIYSVIIYQALLNAVIGFCIASVIGFGVVYMTSSGALPVVITPLLMIGIFALTVAMCVASGFTAIMRVTRIDPVMVFTR